MLRSLLARLLALLATIAAVCAFSSSALASTTRGQAALDLPAKAECPYSQHEITVLAAFDRMVGRSLDCVQVYANAATTWAQWEMPWFINYVNEPNLDWSQWATRPRADRRLIITLNLFPSSLNHADWLDAGASGAYGQYAVKLAENLVSAGLGNSIIRLAPEMNGTWYPYSLGSTPAQWKQWDAFYANTVEAMRSVTGAHFAFDWCINAAVRALPLSEIYPGDKVVDIIGIDAYDTGANLGSTGSQRWSTLMHESDGIGQLLAFARSQGKPISIPEWGVAPAKYSGGGDDAAYVNGIASVVREDPVVYESYFFKYDYASQLTHGPAALAAYRRHFGAHGDSVDAGSDSW